jgi:hypothetical protein
MHTKTVLMTFAIITALGIILTATSLPTQPSPTGFGITLCSSRDTVGGNACLPTDKAPS